MIELTYPIEDAHGNVHQNAVIVINQLSAQSNTSTNLYMTNTSGNVTYNTGHSQTNKSISCQVHLYKDCLLYTSDAADE